MRWRLRLLCRKGYFLSQAWGKIHRLAYGLGRMESRLLFNMRPIHPYPYSHIHTHEYGKFKVFFRDLAQFDV
jgi:hypothetical protein